MRDQSFITYLIWALLLVVSIAALVTARWSLAFVSTLTLLITFLPLLFQSWAGIRIPRGFTAAIIFFTVATIFLGEVGDFYERFWWWDIALHTGSAIGFGMIGAVMTLMLVRGNRLTTSAGLTALFAFTFGVAIGALWEIFEFAMDQIFGLNMQKSGLIDTMYDLIVNCVGAAIGALAGYAYFRGHGTNWLSQTIAKFVRDNSRLFGGQHVIRLQQVEPPERDSKTGRGAGS
jgi:hypothetical protein